MAVAARPAVSIRRHRFSDLSLSDLTALGTLDAGVATFLSAAVQARKNIVVSGAMNSGKTTLLRALAAEIARLFKAHQGKYGSPRTCGMRAGR